VGSGHIWHLVNQGVRSAPSEARPQFSPASQPEPQNLRQIGVTLQFLANASLPPPSTTTLAPPPWPFAVLPQESLLATPPPPKSHPPQQKRAMPAAPRFPFEIIAAMYGPKQ
jgi:hypothetical protein